MSIVVGIIGVSIVGGIIGVSIVVGNDGGIIGDGVTVIIIYVVRKVTIGGIIVIDKVSIIGGNKGICGKVGIIGGNKGIWGKVCWHIVVIDKIATSDVRGEGIGNVGITIIGGNKGICIDAL